MYQKTLTVNRKDMLEAYSQASTEGKTMLEKLFGHEAFAFDYREVDSYEQACKILGIEPREFKAVGDRPQYMRMANAMQQLLVICEAINANGQWYDEDGWGYYPVFVLYSKEEMAEMGEAKCKEYGIHQLLAAALAIYAEYAGVRCANTANRGASTNATYGFPLCLNSEEKAKYVGEQFFELCCACYGITPKMD